MSESRRQCLTIKGKLDVIAGVGTKSGVGGGVPDSRGLRERAVPAQVTGCCVTCVTRKKCAGKEKADVTH